MCWVVLLAKVAVDRLKLNLPSAVDDDPGCSSSKAQDCLACLW